MTDKMLDRLLDQIEQLDTDEQLDLVVASLQVARRRIVEAQTKATRGTLARGDRVRLVGRLSPKYLLGLEGVVAARPTDKRVRVKLDHPSFAQRYAREDGTLDAPLMCVEKIAGKPNGRKGR